MQQFLLIPFLFNLNRVETDSGLEAGRERVQFLHEKFLFLVCTATLENRLAVQCSHVRAARLISESSGQRHQYAVLL